MRTVHLVVVAAVLVLLAGCGSDEEAATTTTAPEAESAEPFGEFEREVTQAELDRVAEKRAEGEQTPPTGTYQLSLTEGVLLVSDPEGFSISQELTVADETLTLERYIGEGGFCRDDDASVYAWQLEGDKLTLSPEDDGCADREAILSGSWSKSR
jgi:hypothetical protein